MKSNTGSDNSSPESEGGLLAGLSAEAQETLTILGCVGYLVAILLAFFGPTRTQPIFTGVAVLGAFLFAGWWLYTLWRWWRNPVTRNLKRAVRELPEGDPETIDRALDRAAEPGAWKRAVNRSRYWKELQAHLEAADEKTKDRLLRFACRVPGPTPEEKTTLLFDAYTHEETSEETRRAITRWLTEEAPATFLAWKLLARIAETEDEKEIRTLFELLHALLPRNPRFPESLETARVRLKQKAHLFEKTFIRELEEGLFQ